VPLTNASSYGDCPLSTGVRFREKLGEVARVLELKGYINQMTNLSIGLNSINENGTQIETCWAIYIYVMTLLMEL
jgi:hypothetical protein